MYQLGGLTQKRESYLQTASAINAKAMAEGRALSSAEAKDFDGLMEKIRGMDETIAVVKGQRELMEAAHGSSPTYRSPLIENPSLGIGVARMVRALAATKGDNFSAAQWAERTFGDSQVSKALAAGSGSAGGFTVPDALSREVIELLRPASVVRRMGATSITMSNGNFSLPKLTSGATASYIGENSNVGVTEETFGQVKLTVRKLAALVPISNDLIRFGGASADGLVRDDLIRAIAVTEDSNFIRGLGTGNGPKGLRYWAPTANVLNVNATVSTANTHTDLGRLMAALLNANVRMLRPGWLMSPRTQIFLMDLRDSNGLLVYPEMAQGRLRGFPFASTTSIPINLAVTDTDESEIYLVDFADVVIGEMEGGFVIDVSSEAAYFDGTSVVSAFSKDQTVVRVIAQHDLVVRHAESIAVLSDVDWAA